MNSALPSKASRPLRGVHVLLVDDDAESLALVTELLEWSGAGVTAVGSADEALGALQREHPDVLLSDLSMPDKGGYWLIGEVRALPAARGGSTPAIALTAHIGPEHRTAVLRAGFQSYLGKPVDIGQLIEVVATLAVPERAHRAS